MRPVRILYVISDTRQCQFVHLIFYMVFDDIGYLYAPKCACACAQELAHISLIARTRSARLGLLLARRGSHAHACVYATYQRDEVTSSEILGYEHWNYLKEHAYRF